MYTHRERRERERERGRKHDATEARVGKRNKEIQQQRETTNDRNHFNSR